MGSRTGISWHAHSAGNCKCSCSTCITARFTRGFQTSWLCANTSTVSPHSCMHTYNSRASTSAVPLGQSFCRNAKEHALVCLSNTQYMVSCRLQRAPQWCVPELRRQALYHYPHSFLTREQTTKTGSLQDLAPSAESFATWCWATRLPSAPSRVAAVRTPCIGDK